MIGRRPNEVTWDHESVRRVWSLAQSDPYIVSCFQVLGMYIFGDNMQVEWVRGNDVQMSHDGFSTHVQQHWQPFAIAMMRHLIMFGVCPYKITTLTSGDKAPVVPTFGTYFLTVQPTHDYQLQYRCYRTATNHMVSQNGYQEDTDMRVLVLNDLDTSGGLHGPLMTVLGIDAFVNDQMRNTTVANWISSNPTIVTTSQEKANTRMEHGMHTFTTSAQQENQQSDRMRSRDKHNIDALQRQMDAVKDFNLSQNSIARDSNTVLEKDSFSQQFQTRQHKKQYQGNMLPLPHGQTITNQVLPRPPHDLMHLLKWQTEIVCAVMGVPKALFGGKEGGGVGVGIKNSVNMRMLNITVNQWKRHLSTFLEKVYWDIYGQDAMQAIVESTPPPPRKKQKKEKAPAESPGPMAVLHTQDASHDARSEISNADTEPTPDEPASAINADVPRVRFVFPFTPSASIEEISYLFDRGAIDQRTEAEYLCKSIGIPLTAVNLHDSIVQKQLEVTGKAKAVQPSGSGDSTQFVPPI